MEEQRRSLMENLAKSIATFYSQPVFVTDSRLERKESFVLRGCHGGRSRLLGVYSTILLGVT